VEELGGRLEARLVDWLEADFGLRCDDAVPVGGGVDRAARLWRVRDRAGRDLAVKWTSGGTAAGFGVARALAEGGVEGVVAPLLARDGRAWSDRDGRRLVVLPWVDAAVALDAGLEERQWVAFGRLLASVHAAPTAALPTLPASDRRHRRVRGAVAALHRVVDAGPSDGNVAVAHDDLVGLVLDQAPLLWETVDALLAGADRLHAVGGSAGNRSSSVVCHADPHLGNVLADDDGGVWLLDWDDAVMAPPEQDLLFVLDGGVLAFAPVTGAQAEAFFVGYGPVEADRNALAFHRSVRALEDLVDFALEVLAPDRHPLARREAAYRYLRGNLATGGLIEAALRSLDEVGALTSMPSLRPGGE
jgi:spectinomycin phosphotransferase